MRIALLSSTVQAVASLRRLLTGPEMEATCFALLDGSVEKIRDGNFDAVVLQHDVPEAVRNALLELRQCGVDAPLIVISGHANVDLRVLVLRLGADDCLATPYSDSELVARIHAVVRRARLKSRTPVMYGPLAIDLDSKTLSANGKPIELTVKEYDLFELLYANRGSVLTKAALIGRLYKGADEPMQKIIDVFICKLRRKIADATDGADYIKTVWGTGYTWQNEGCARAA
jgi:two-component system cell cycle response regulator CtrA